MKTSKLVEILKKGNFVVPLYLFGLRDKLKLDMEQFIFIVYLSNLGDKVLFDINRFSSDLNMDIKTIMIYIDNLTDMKYLSVDVLKNDKGVMEEYISLDLFYDKVTSFMIEGINQEKVSDEANSNIFETIEKEFGRPLTPVEFEIIHAWIEAGTSEEIIGEALKEAVYSGVFNLRYIDKIIYVWNKKGIKTKEQIANNRKNFKEKQEKKEKLELFDYDWFEDGEDE